MKRKPQTGCSKMLVFSLLSKKYCFAITVNTYAKADIKIFLPCPILLHFLTFRQIFCDWLKDSLWWCLKLLVNPSLQHNELFLQSWQNIWQKIRKWSKSGQTRKLRYLLLRKFSLLLSKANFWLTLACVCTRFWDFFSFSNSVTS